MDGSNSSQAQQIAQVAITVERQTAGRLPSSVTVVLREDTLEIALLVTMS